MEVWGVRGGEKYGQGWVGVATVAGIEVAFEDPGDWRGLTGIDED